MGSYAHSKDQNHRQSMLPDVPEGIIENTAERLPHISFFWEIYRQWLAARGVHLFKINGDGCWAPPNQHTTSGSTSFPWGVCCDTKLHNCYKFVNRKLAPARDAYSRDLMIKLVHTNTTEYAIYEQLLRCKSLFEHKYQGVLPPVAILDTQHTFSFVVMPRWGIHHRFQTVETVNQALACMQSLLQGLVVLHSLRIAHRDIDIHNIMINGYTVDQYWDTFQQDFFQFRRGTNVSYCLFDFDQSFQFPLDSAYDDCRLPANEACVSMTMFRPPDFRLGEHDYNPLSYDVGCLGNFFRAYFASVVPLIPLMAVLFDQMTTHIKPERFTAEEALTFLEQTISDLPGSVLRRSLERVETWDGVDSFWETLYDPTLYWAQLTIENRRGWSQYQIPPLTGVEKFLLWVTALPLGWDTLHFCRSILHV